MSGIFPTPGPVPPETTNIASYHTHTDLAGSTEHEISGTDVIYTHTDKRPGYMAGTNEKGIGKFLRFTPGGTTASGVIQVMGTISNGLFVPNPAYDRNKKPYELRRAETITIPIETRTNT